VMDWDMVAGDILAGFAVMESADAERNLLAAYLRMVRLQGERDGIESVARAFARQKVA
jgi:hypothetical protein